MRLGFQFVPFYYGNISVLWQILLLMDFHKLLTILFTSPLSLSGFICNDPFTPIGGAQMFGYCLDTNKYIAAMVESCSIVGLFG